jgi:hypothetical protein
MLLPPAPTGLGRVAAAVTEVFTSEPRMATVKIVNASQMAEIAKMTEAGTLERFFTGNPNLPVNFIMTRNVDMYLYGEMMRNRGWAPIGTTTRPFRSIFDGGGFYVQDMFINDPGLSYPGLFGRVAGTGVVRNIGLVNPTVNGETVGDFLVGSVGAGGRVENNFSVNARATPTSLMFREDQIHGVISVAGGTAEGMDITYQWHINTENSNRGGDAIEGATGATFTIPEDLEAGTHFFYCVIGATVQAQGIFSNVVRVQVEPVIAEIVNLAIHTAPRTSGYQHGDMLDLSELIVTITYDNGAALDVPFDYLVHYDVHKGFDDYDGGAVHHEKELSLSRHHGRGIRISHGEIAVYTAPLTIDKAVQQPLVVDISAATYGDAPFALPVSDALSEGTGAIRFERVDGAASASAVTANGTMTIADAINIQVRAEKAECAYYRAVSATFWVPVSPRDIDDFDITANVVGEHVFTGSQIRPTIAATDANPHSIIRSYDYSLDFGENINAGTMGGGGGGGPFLFPAAGTHPGSGTL